MSPLLITAAVLLVLIALAHSCLGERLLIGPLLKDPNVVIFKRAPLTKNILRFAWHITTVAWWGMAAAILDMQGGENLLSMYIYIATFVVTGVMILAWTKGKHVAWIVFFAIAGCLFAAA
ncbi:conserved hypothetical protein [Desulfatibacillum aliphaticivorans]|uniref:Uncharacterized protein n=1 Tax=Desulfatibacillum aliphaticivorans TaxID=218208 RepID=B8FEW7_DESAL|nr:hypothetical protein [Desulfatibacillum aliphaticivorans]ACL03644.1 conserved hypothetical protein [Desulfatibacillum aliphaticivorans]